MGIDHEVHLGKIHGWRRSRYGGMFLMHCLGEGWDVSHSVCSLYFVPHFGTRDLGNAGTWPRGSQARVMECWGQLHQLLLQCTDLGFSLVTMMGNPDPGNSDHHHLQKMQFNPTNIYRTHTLCVGQEMKTRPLSSRSPLSNGGRRRTYASLAANRSNREKQSALGRSTFDGGIRGESFLKEVKPWKLRQSATGRSRW